jgi:hypothetical protein
MICNLIDGSNLIPSFLELIDNKGHKNSPSKQSRVGAIHRSHLPMDIQLKLPSIFGPMPTDSKYKKLFDGDITGYPSQSEADLAFSKHMANRKLTINEADQVMRASGLYRDKWDRMTGDFTYGQHTLNKAFEGAQMNKSYVLKEEDLKSNRCFFRDRDQYRPVYIPNGMPPRNFVGPSIYSGIRLFPANALSTLVALGAMGKTSLLLSIACHVAAGKDWNNSPLKQQKVVMFFCEEDQQEINRKFSAIISSWTSDEQALAIENLLLIPLLGADARLTIIERNQYKASGVTEEIIELLREFGIKDGLVILDHMQGLASGDLNISETATSICREANKIVESTGSAVVFAHHISKVNIKAEEFTQGFAVGSLAFENAIRQMSGLIPMTNEKAKKYGLEQTRNEYVWLSLAKNSYGSPSNGVWLKKCVSPEYHTVVMEPVILTQPIPASKLSELQKIAKRILDHLAKHPNTTRNILDGLSGKDRDLKASKAKVRDCLKTLIDSGDIDVIAVTDEIRQKQSIPKQVKEILQINTTKPADKPANNNSLRSWEAD